MPKNLQELLNSQFYNLDSRIQGEIVVLCISASSAPSFKEGLFTFKTIHISFSILNFRLFFQKFILYVVKSQEWNVLTYVLNIVNSHLEEEFIEQIWYISSWNLCLWKGNIVRAPYPHMHWEIWPAGMIVNNVARMGGGSEYLIWGPAQISYIFGTGSISWFRRCNIYRYLTGIITSLISSHEQED